MTELPPIQDPQPYAVPPTGFLLEYEGQIYEVLRTCSQVNLERDPEGRDRHTLDVQFRAVWTEEGYRDPEELL